MTTKLIKGLSQVQSKYDVFFIDLWGVIHNGVNLYPEAIIVLENLKYAFAPKDLNDPNFIGNAYFFGSNIGIDNLLKIGGQNLKKSIQLFCLWDLHL